MFYCERCGTRFNAAAATNALACPRCRTKDGVYSALTFELYDPAVRAAVPRSPVQDLEGRCKEVAGGRTSR
jgi:predicted  nucleic acid-binding Zn-ribbon protein